mmetsp:Transcript_14550/g.27458  ORF Transcript_14550/g.27458 Transcript_14550/m.27458 type:complete len:220 (-) Transcript_14550:105-764(-)
MAVLSSMLAPVIVYPLAVACTVLANPLECALWALAYVLVAVESLMQGVGHTVTCYEGMYTASFVESCRGLLRLADSGNEVLLNALYGSSITLAVLVASAVAVLTPAAVVLALVVISSPHPSAFFTACAADDGLDGLDDSCANANDIKLLLLGMGPAAPGEPMALAVGGLLALWVAFVFLRAAATTVLLCALEENRANVDPEQRHGSDALVRAVVSSGVR